MPALLGTLTDIRAALDQGLTRTENARGGESVGIAFKTAASLDDTWPIMAKNNMPGGVRPTHLWVSDLHRADGALVVDAFSVTWELDQAGMLLLTLQGLVAATDYKLSVLYE